MRPLSLVVPVVALLFALTACQRPAEEAGAGNAAAPATEPAPGAAPAAEPAAAPTPPETSAEPPAAAPAVAPAQAPAGAVLASQESNWQGVVVEVTELRRKGNTLTAHVRLRNQGDADVEPAIVYGEPYLLDTAAGKKYEVLKDEGGAYIAALRSGWKDRWYDTLKPGQSARVWMKFPAPPPEVKAVTLQIPSTPPFEDLPIQDS